MLYPLSYRRVRQARARGDFTTPRRALSRLSDGNAVGQESVGQPHLVAGERDGAPQPLEGRDLLFRKTVLFLTEGGRKPHDRHGGLDRAGAFHGSSGLNWNAHRAAGNRAVHVDETASVGAQGRTRQRAESLSQGVLICIVPVVEKGRLAQPRIGRFEGRHVRTRPLVEAAPHGWIDRRQALPQLNDIEDRDREGTVAARAAAAPAWERLEERRMGAIKPSCRPVMEGAERNERGVRQAQL